MGRLTGNIMKILFYLASSYLLFHEFIWIMRPIDRAKESLKKIIIVNGVKNKKYETMNDDEKSILKNELVKFILIWGWLFVGIFTFQWQVFLAFMVMELFVFSPLIAVSKKVFPLYVSIHWINSIIGLLFVLFTIINSYHLKIDINIIDWIK